MNYPPVQVGDVFGRWTVVGGPLGLRYLRWECRCACGAVKVVWAVNLKRGKSRSCGCFRKEWAGWQMAAARAAKRDAAEEAGMVGITDEDLEWMRKYQDRLARKPGARV